MQYDICDGAVSLTSVKAREAWDGLIRAFLAHSANAPTYLGAVLEEEPDFAMGHAAKGLFSLMLGRKELIPVAQGAYRTARAGRTSSVREQLWVKALGLWLDGRPSAAIACMEDILKETPQDSFSAKVSQAIRFMLGDAKGMRQSIERILPAHDPSHPMRGFMLGCLAFGLEETGEYKKAEAIGLEGLDHAPDDAWGLHAVTHVYDMTAQPLLGLALIEEKEAAWDHCNNFRYHVWWHKALLHLDQGDYDLCLQLYDQKIRHDKTDDFRDISNATSLLMRLELEGVQVGTRWEELADLCEHRTEDGCLVFADLHYMLALGAAGRFDAAGQMAVQFTTNARKPGEMAERVADPGLAALAGLHSFAEGRYDTAFLNLATARPAMQTIGGSHAQRDVFERMTIDAGLRAGFVDEVEQVLSERLALRKGAEDNFTTTRFAALSEMRKIPAQ